MNHFSFELALLALVPAIILCGYIFYKDRIEKEPVGLLFILLGAGAVGYFATHFLQELIVGGIDKLFEKYMTFSESGVLSFTSSGMELLHSALCSFLGFAAIQILIHWCLLFFITHKNKNFNYLFDGIVYSVFLSLGYIIVENIHFGLENDPDMILPKLLTSISSQLFVGILMGNYYTMWHMRFVANGIEKDMLEAGIVKEDKVRSSAIWLVASLIIPMFEKGLYYFATSSKIEIIVTIFYFVVFVLYGVSFIIIDRMAGRDTSSKRYLCRIIEKGHTDLSKEQIEDIVANGVKTPEKEADAE